MFGKTDPASDSTPTLNPSLGSQLEDLFVHVMKCENWARLDDRIDLSLAGIKRAQERHDADRPRR